MQPGPLGQSVRESYRIMQRMLWTWQQCLWLSVCNLMHHKYHQDALPVKRPASQGPHASSKGATVLGNATAGLFGIGPNCKVWRAGVSSSNGTGCGRGAPASAAVADRQGPSSW